MEAEGGINGVSPRSGPVAGIVGEEDAPASIGYARGDEGLRSYEIVDEVITSHVLGGMIAEPVPLTTNLGRHRSRGVLRLDGHPLPGGHVRQE